VILTVTPNPSIDYLFEAETLCWDDANRVEMPRKRAGGQGINLTRAARALGGESVALALFGGSAGLELKHMLAEEGTPVVDVAIPGDTRVFFGVRETSSGRSMLINPRGPILMPEISETILAEMRRACAAFAPAWIVCSGSIPRGLHADLYARCSQIAKEHGIKFIADCDGEALSLAANSGCELLAPNQHEAERLTYTSIKSEADAITAARALRSLAPEVLLKLGGRGAVLATRSGTWIANGPYLKNGSAVGAGDSFLAAFLVAQENGAPPEEALRSAVAAGTAVLLSRGSDLLTRSDYESILRDVMLTAQ
jgi:6-phosphofructokinase 2